MPVVVIGLDGLLRDIEAGRSPVMGMVSFAVTLLVFVAVGWLNRRAARELRERMRALEEG